MKALHAIKRIFKSIFLATVLFFYVDPSLAQSTLQSNKIVISNINNSNSKTANITSNTITASQTQPISFGTYCVTGTSGGTITVNWDGTRTSTGNIVLMAMQPIAQPAIFEIKVCQGRNISITYVATTTLNGSNGGSLDFDIGPTEKGINGSNFAIKSDCNIGTQLRVGGTLHIPSTAIPGTYSGRFDITFNQD